MNDSKANSIWNQRYRDGAGAVTEVGTVGDPLDYTTHPFLWREAIARRITGSLNGDPPLDVASKHLSTPAERMLAIGSGLASMEEWYVKCGFAKHCLAYEASRTAVEKARQRIDAEGLSDRLEIRCADPMEDNLPDATFDLVFVQAAIHHFFKIEEMFQLMHRVLKPGGLLIYDEYVGPDHLIFDDKTLDLMDAIDQCLAPSYRFDSQTRKERHGVNRATLEQMIEFDPSEGVHASEILPLTYQYFSVIDRRDYGGTFMRPFFTGILNNFDFTDEKDQTVARLIVLLEEMLLKHSIISHAHTVVVARRRDIPRAPLTPAERERIAFDDWAGLAEE
jgi:ubiquinone/menaquinone biosynthesis C-methylase UbiE